MPQGVPPAAITGQPPRLAAAAAGGRPAIRKPSPTH